MLFINIRHDFTCDRFWKMVDRIQMQICARFLTYATGGPVFSSSDTSDKFRIGLLITVEIWRPNFTPYVISILNGRTTTMCFTIPITNHWENVRSINDGLTCPFYVKIYLNFFYIKQEQFCHTKFCKLVIVQIVYWKIFESHISWNILFIINSDNNNIFSFKLFSYK